VLHTGPDISGLQAGAYHAPRQLADHALTVDGQRIPLQSLAKGHGRPLHAVAGLARPEAFFKMLRQSGLQLASTTALPDHHNYQNWPADPGKTWLCTEKDAAKLWQHEPGALAVPLVLTPESGFWHSLDQRIQQLLKP
jgi:tetraacyldisaccharide 4'-kinase